MKSTPVTPAIGSIALILLVLVFSAQTGFAQISTNTHDLSTTFDGSNFVYAEDIDSDGDIDLVGAAFVGDDLTWWENDGFAHFTEHIIRGSGTTDGIKCVKAVDLDEDGDIDLVTASYYSDDVAWWENNGSESFTEHTIDGSLDGAFFVDIDDIDGDGDLDVAAVGYAAGDIIWYDNNGSETFTPRTVNATFAGASCVEIADLNGDTDLDLVATAVTDGDLIWYENDGSVPPSWTPRNVDLSYTGARSVYPVDIDGDTDIDMVSAAQGLNQTTWWDNDGNDPPTFTENTLTNTDYQSWQVYAADVDSDGDMDILGAVNEDGEINFWENDGSENFTRRLIASAYINARSVYAEDLDGDGDIDVIGASYNLDSYTWWENITDYAVSSTVTHPILRDVYTMIGVPTGVSDGDASTLFTDDITGAIGAPNWRVSRWNVADSTYYRHSEDNYPIQIGGDPPDFVPGLGFWLKQRTTDNTVLDITGNGSVTQIARYEVDLQDATATYDGLNMMANPYFYMYDVRTTSFRNATTTQTVNYADAVTNGWINGNIYRWDGDNSQYITFLYTESDANIYNIGVWEGFWIPVTTQNDMKMRFAPDSWGGGLAPKRDDNQITWRMDIAVHTADGEFRDEYNGIGASTMSEDGYDGCDAFELSPFSDAFVQLYFQHEDWEDVHIRNFTYDYRSMDFAEPKSWEFTVRGWNVTERDIEISWPNIGEIDLSYSLMLEDLDGNVTIDDMHDVNGYTFASGEDALCERHFRITVAENPTAVEDLEGEIIPDNYGLVSVYPNPFNESVRISYNLPSDGLITLKVLDIQGREVALLQHGNMTAGMHNTHWKAENMASGAYMLQLEHEGVVTTSKALLLR